MKILFIDNDLSSLALAKSRLESAGYTVFEENSKANGIEIIEKQGVNIVFFNPTPMNNPRSTIMNMRRHIRQYPYIALIKEQDMEFESGLSGANDVIAKPIDPERLVTMVESAVRVSNLVKQIGDDKEDFPSAGGVIAKSAFNQLFLSALDRADRYDESAYLLLISVANYTHLRDMGGNYTSDYAVAKLSQNLVRQRRQSDIIGQIGKSEFALLLQRPQYESEPMEAAKRFTDELSKLTDMTQDPSMSAELSVKLVALPSGDKPFGQRFSLGQS